LCRTHDDRAFYFSKVEKRVYELEQEIFSYLLTNVSGLSPTEAEFRFTQSMLRADAAKSRPVEVYTLAHFDSTTGLLAISDAGPGLWVREKHQAWNRRHNGDCGLFFTEPDAVAWEPDLTAGPDALDWFLSKIPFADRGDLTIEDQQATFLIVLMQLFFPAYRRTAVIPAFLGPQGSGKTTAMRLTGRLLIGPKFDVMGLRADKEDAFVAAVTNRTACALDNADSRIKWLEDALATYATRQRYQLRKLYTTNDLLSYAPRAFLMLSSRDPHFRRPDVSERLLPFHFERLASYQDEGTIYDELEARRPAIMGALLNRLASLADALPQIEAPRMPFRMADYAAFGWRVFKACGREGDWLTLLSRLEAAQAGFAADGDGLIEVLRTLLERDGRIGPIKSGELFLRCSVVAAERGLPLPRTASGFGQKLTNMRRVIELELRAKLIEERGHQRGRTITIEARS
jgi:hypothetical protein